MSDFSNYVRIVSLELAVPSDDTQSRAGPLFATRERHLLLKPSKPVTGKCGKGEKARTAIIWKFAHPPPQTSDLGPGTFPGLSFLPCERRITLCMYSFSKCESLPCAQPFRRPMRKWSATPEHDSNDPSPQKHPLFFIVEVIRIMVIIFIFLLIVLASFPLKRGKNV